MTDPLMLDPVDHKDLPRPADGSCYPRRVLRRRKLAVLADSSAAGARTPRSLRSGREADGSPHVNWGMHMFDERLAALVHHPALVSTSRQLLDDDFYVHQSRINMSRPTARSSHGIKTSAPITASTGCPTLAAS